MEDNIYNLIKENPDGIERASIISIINDQLHISEESANKYLMDLIVKNKIILISDNSFERFQSVDNQSKERQLDIKIIGAPQSSNATFVLNQTLISYPNDLILIVDVTHPKAFKEIEKRIQSKLKTTVLLPSKKEIGKERYEYYEEVIKEWKQLYKRNKSYNSLSLLKSTLINGGIKTTMFTDEFARINVRNVIPTTTRNGIIIEVDKDNTLYTQYLENLKKQLKTSLPFFTLNPIKYLQKTILIPLIMLCLIIGAILFYNNTTWLAVISSVFCGILGNIIYGKYKTT